MKRFFFPFMALWLALAPALTTPLQAAPAQQGACLFFTETGGGRGGFSVCDDTQARFRSAFNSWGLQKIGYPISQRYIRDGFVTQAFQKAIMQWRSESGSVVLVNIFDDLHNDQFDERLLVARQTPRQFPAGWDKSSDFAQIVRTRQALLNVRPAIRSAYFSSNDPLTFFGLPTSEVMDMGNHYAVRLQRAVLQEWKENVPWARAGQVTIANGGDIAKELGGLPAAALEPQSGVASTPPIPSGPTQPAPAPAPAPAPTGGRPFASPEYGMQAFMWWRPEVADRDAGLIRDAGFKWVKQDFAWREIEGAGRGAYDWSRADGVVNMVDRFGLKLLARVDRQPGWATGGRCAVGVEMGPPDNIQDWTNFLTALATRYRGRIDAYAIWNEPNLAREWCGQAPDPAGYARLLRAAYTAIKAVDPNAIIISAGLSPTGGPMPIAMEDTTYLEGLYNATGGTLNGYADVVGVHAPGFKAPPELSPDQVMADTGRWGNGRYFTFRRVEDLRAIMVRRGDAARQMAILEMGWTTDPRPDSPYNWHAVDEATQSAYLVRAFQYAKQNWSPWMGLMSLIYICNADWGTNDEQYYWCVTEPSYPQTITRPAYDALRNMAK